MTRSDCEEWVLAKGTSTGEVESDEAGSIAVPG